MKPTLSHVHPLTRTPTHSQVIANRPFNQFSEDFTTIAGALKNINGAMSGNPQLVAALATGQVTWPVVLALALRNVACGFGLG